jgi:hypothetical protein
MCVLALMEISVEGIVWLLCVASSFMLVLALGKALEELRLCNQGWSIVIGCWIWFLFIFGLLAMFPHKRPSDDPSLFYPYTTMIVFLLPYAAGGIGLAGVMLLGFILNIFRKRKEPAMQR